MFLHIGLPKTGTTYLQGVLWGNRDRLWRDGVFLPGFGHREHLWAALDLQERPRLHKRHPRAPGAWGRLVEEGSAQDADVLITHEFFCAATAAQARHAVDAFPHSQVHLIITARDSAGIVTAGWQESVKNGGTVDLDSVIRGEPAGAPEFSLLSWDLHGVLDRWGGTVPADRVHVVTMPARGESSDLHWRNFASVLDVDPGPYEAPEEAANPALGIVQIELLRRINAQLPKYSALDRGTWIRGYLAERRLAGQEGQRVGLTEGDRMKFLERDRVIVEMIGARGFDVVGDLSRLLGDNSPAAPQRLAKRVGDDELVESAARLVADIVSDVRASTGDVPP